MREWIVILLIGLAILAVGVWVLRRRTETGGRRQVAGTTPNAGGLVVDALSPRQPPASTSPISSRSTPSNGQSDAADARQSSAADDRGIGNAAATQVGGDAPNTKVMPHPDDMPLATLEFEGPPGRVQVRRSETVIGRHSGDDIRVPDVRVSRHHARLVARGDGGFEIHNLTAVRSEPNQMLVNGESREHADVADGDVVTLGGVSFRFMLAAG